MLEVLSTAVEQLVLDANDLSDGELHQVVVGLQRQIDRLCAVQPRHLQSWDARKVWAEDGSRSAGHCYARNTGLSISDAKRLVHRARRLSSMTLCQQAFLDGDLSISRADLLVRTNTTEVSDVFARDEAQLLENVKSLSFSHAAKTLHYWAQCANEANAESKAERQLDDRSCRAVRTFDGTVDVQASLDSVGGEIFLTEFESIEKELFEEDWAEGKERLGGDVSVYDLKRTNAQRRGDALVEMARRSAAAGSNSRQPKPLITVVVGYETFAGRVCELASGSILTPGQIVPLLGEADIERVVFDGPKRVIDVSRKRSFTGALRRAIEVRDQHCQHSSGCDVPANRCEVDHVVAYVKTQATHQHNGQLLCGRHNRAKGTGPP